MKKFLVVCLLIFALTICCLAVVGCNEPKHEAVMDNVKYDTLQQAVEAVGDTKQTIVLAKDVSGDGIKILENKNIVFDLKGHTIEINGNKVGSAGTETNGFQILKGGNITFKNGTIKQGENGAKILVQNYSNLSLEDVTLDATNENAQTTCLYALSNNFGKIKITGKTNIVAEEGQRSFDLWYGMNKYGEYDEGVSVTFDENFTGTVSGIVEYGAASRNTDSSVWIPKTKLKIAGGNFKTGEFVKSSSNFEEQINAEITGGKFDFDVSNYVNKEEYKVVEKDGQFIVSDK